MALCFLFILVGDSKELAKYMFEKIQKHQYKGRDWPQVTYRQLDNALMQVAQVTLNTDLPPYLLAEMGMNPDYLEQVKTDVIGQIEESLRHKEQTKTLGQRIFWFHPLVPSMDKLQ